MQTIRTAAALALLVTALTAQPDAVLRFEVAAIKPTPPEQWSGPSGGTAGKGRYAMHNRTLKDYIWRAWLTVPERVAGGPAWVESERFDIEAKSEQPVDDDRVLMAMLRTLLEERFNLKVHIESRPGDSLVLTVAKGGPKLGPGSEGAPRYNNLHDTLDATNLPMSELASILSRNLRLPVADQTGLAGGFSFSLRWNPGPADLAEPQDVAAILRSEVGRAMAAQLGLQLEHRRTSVEILVIDHADQPSAN
jgi:uncharacterized protein (TIGR03435 family)